MSLVLDALIAGPWFLPDKSHPIAASVLTRLDQAEAHVPAIWGFEIRNLLLKAERRNRLTVEQSQQAFVLLQRLPIRTESLPRSEGVESLARQHRLTFYDAAYLELAQRERLPLATLDRELREAALTEGVELVQAS